MPTPKAYLGHHCKVLIGDIAVPRVRTITIHAPSDGIVVTTLELIGHVSYNEGVFRIELDPKPALTGRAITMNGVPIGDIIG